jgi:hypothetical protein
MPKGPKGQKRPADVIANVRASTLTGFVGKSLCVQVAPNSIYFLPASRG